MKAEAMPSAPILGESEIVNLLVKIPKSPIGLAPKARKKMLLAVISAVHQGASRKPTP